MVQQTWRRSLFFLFLCLLITGCQKLEDEEHDPFVPTELEPVELYDVGYGQEPSVSPTPQLGGTVNESLKDGQTVGIISDGRLTANGLQLSGGDGFIRYRVQTIPSGFVEFSASGFTSNELHGSEEFKAVLLTMWSADDGYVYESAPYIFEFRKFGHIPGRADATDSVSIRIKSQGVWEVGHYGVLSWHSGTTYRFRVEWGGGQARVLRNGTVVASGIYRPEFRPSNHHIQIGAQPLRRKESPYNLLISDVVIGVR